MTLDSKRLSLKNSKINSNAKDHALNITEKQAAIAASLFSQASFNSSDSPVAYALISILPNGQAITTLANIEPEHVPIIIEAGINAKKQMVDFFDDIDNHGAKIIPIKEVTE